MRRRAAANPCFRTRKEPMLQACPWYLRYSSDKAVSGMGFPKATSTQCKFHSISEHVCGGSLVPALGSVLLLQFSSFHLRIRSFQLVPDFAKGGNGLDNSSAQKGLAGRATKVFLGSCARRNHGKFFRNRDGTVGSSTTSVALPARAMETPSDMSLLTTSVTMRNWSGRLNRNVLKSPRTGLYNLCHSCMEMTKGSSDAGSPSCFDSRSSRLM
mmetsp:Transcript_41809/g.95935  ORF Transcript_41809/g.95935 Transcript_41809/m.95935 type:complete len:213 (+) Transcript_41809:391-1029(+)